MKNSEELTKSIVYASVEFLNQEMAKAKTLNLNNLKHSLTEFLNQLIYSKTDRKPIVIPVFMPIETEQK